MISIHGLIRSNDLELGRDADTGGQVLYVIELTKALAQHERVARVDLFTRIIHDTRIDDSYAQPLEPLADNARIVRIPCGPRRYLHKERLWSYLEQFSDNMLRFFLSEQTDSVRDSRPLCRCGVCRRAGVAEYSTFRLSLRGIHSAESRTNG